MYLKLHNRKNGYIFYGNTGWYPNSKVEFKTLPNNVIRAITQKDCPDWARRAAQKVYNKIRNSNTLSRSIKV